MTRSILGTNGFRVVILAIAMLLFGWTSSRAESIRVMTFNLWHGGDGGEQPLAQSIAVIRAAQADIVGLQETRGITVKGQERPDRAAQIATTLKWHYLDQGGRTGIISRYPIVASTPKKWGAKIRLPSGDFVYHFNVHFAPSPYQPYQLLKIPYGNAPFITSETEAIRYAKSTRGRSAQAMLAEVVAAESESLATFVSGDFNEPSCHDWTDAAERAGLCPIAVDWPTTKLVMDAGFVDGYRLIHPDPVKSPGMTWTPTTQADDPKDHHDRIDFVFVNQSPRVRIQNASVIGESSQTSEIVVAPYPSDHRAVVIEVDIK